MGVTDYLKHAYNVFTNVDTVPQRSLFSEMGQSYGVRPDTMRLRIGNERTIIASIYTRMAVDFASADFRHIRLDEQNRYKEDINSGLNDCFVWEANIDQAPSAFQINLAAALFDIGHIAIVPVDLTLDPSLGGGWDIQSMRVGEILEWKPRHVRVSVYNDKTGLRESKWLEKKNVGIVQNPLYQVMNEHNSTLQRLIRKLSILDAIDEQAGSGKLDLIIQLPYVVKSETRKAQAEQRRKDIEFQLKGSQYGIAYTDGTEKITQLNRPAENNLLKEVQDLITRLYAELGLTADVMNGTADEATMLNYHHRTIKPLLDAVVEEMRRKFLTKTARTQKQTIDYFTNPFKLVPISQLAEIGDKFTRNEIFSSNEIRGFMGAKPSTDPRADQLRNSNMPDDKLGMGGGTDAPASSPESAVPADDTDVNSVFDGFDASLDKMLSDLGGE